MSEFASFSDDESQPSARKRTKRQKTLDELMMEPSHLPASKGAVNKPGEKMTYDDITSVRHLDCFACKSIDAHSLKANEKYYQMMSLYTNNSTALCKDAIFMLIREYFEREILPYVGEERDWPLECIREHFSSHTLYATDEILAQIHLTAGVRNHLRNSLIIRNGSEMTYDKENIKLIMALNREMRTLRTIKDQLPNMIGFDPTLNY